MEIHRTATVHPQAILGEGVTIGPYAVIGSKVIIGKDSSIAAHAVIENYTEIGEDCQVFSHAIIGSVPQHMGFKGEETWVRIGNRCVIREFSTIHRGTAQDKGQTVISDDCYIMAYAHVAHDCIVGKSVILANCAALAGHILIEDHAIVGGLTGVHQHVRIGAYSMVGGGSGLPMDIVPYAMASGNRIQIYGVNAIGLKRHGFSPKAITDLKHAYKILFYSHLNTTQALARIKAEFDSTPEINHLLEFIKSSKRGITKRVIHGHSTKGFKI